jgi:hypothetical protein
MVILDHRLLLPVSVGLLDLPLTAARTAATAAVKVFVGVQAQEEQAIDFATLYTCA